jgi:hypothetical protein
MEDTEMLTKEEILKRLEKENVDLRRKPERIFVYYVEKGLLPKSEDRNKQWEELDSDDME